MSDDDIYVEPPKNKYRVVLTSEIFVEAKSAKDAKEVAQLLFLLSKKDGRITTTITATKLR